MAAKRSQDVVALEAVYQALEPLEPDARGRVLLSVSQLLPISGPALPVSPGEGPPGGRVYPDTHSATRTVSSRPVSLVELMQDKNPSTNPQKIALFAYYRDKYEGIPRFERNELRQYFARAKAAPPANFDRDFIEVVRKGWVHEDGGDSYVTSRGIEAVEGGFSAEPARSGRKPRGKKPRKAVKGRRGKS